MTTTIEAAPAAFSPAVTPLKPSPGRGRRPVDRSAFDEAWRRRLTDAVSDASTPQIRAWIRAQRRARRAGKLTPARKAVLDRELPGWSADADERWMEAATDLVDYEDLHGALPTAAGNADSRRLSRWLAYQQSRHAAGKLPKDRIKWLDKKLPGWATAKAGTRG